MDFHQNYFLRLEGGENLQVDILVYLLEVAIWVHEVSGHLGAAGKWTWADH